MDILVVMTNERQLSNHLQIARSKFVTIFIYYWLFLPNVKIAKKETETPEMAEIEFTMEME